MADMHQWVPMRWQWADPALLAILDRTPVNCLVVDWTAGAQQALAPLVTKGKAAGLAFVGMVSGGDRAALFASARAAGLDAVIAEGAVPDAGLPVLPLCQRAKAPWQSSSPILVVKDNVWPAVALAQGGMLLASRNWPGERGAPAGQNHPRIDSRPLGKGKLAIAKSDSPDPYMVTRDIHVLFGRAEDLTRYYNIEAFISSYTASPDGKRALFQATNFSQRMADDRVSIWFRNRYRAARLWTIGSRAASPALLQPENGGILVQVPGMRTYAALELSE